MDETPGMAHWRGVVPAWFRCIALSTTAVACALLPRALLDSLLAERSVFILFTLAVMVSARFGGVYCGAVATGLSILAGEAVFIEGSRNGSERLANWIEVALFAVTGLGISWLAEQLRIARSRAETGERTAASARRETEMVLTSINDGFVALDANLRLVYANPKVEHLAGIALHELRGRSILDIMPETWSAEIAMRLEAAVRERKPVAFEQFFPTLQQWFEIKIFPAESRSWVVYFSDITERKVGEREREALVAQLQDALAEVKTLSGFLPICSECKKIRDAEDRWQQLESYISQHSNAEFSHGFCPECFQRLYPEHAAAQS